VVADPCDMVDPVEKQRDMPGDGPRAGLGRASGAGEELRGTADLGEDAAILTLARGLGSFFRSSLLDWLRAVCEEHFRLLTGSALAWPPK
jgi:hypothetical protein